MNVKIKTVYGELSFNMAQDDALALISKATNYADAYADAEVSATERKVERNDAAPAYAYAMNVVAEMEKPTIPAVPLKPVEKPEPKSRLEELFGAKADWKIPASAIAPTEDTESVEGKEPEAYRGFMYIKCEECKKIKGYYVKTPLTFHKCECGHKTTLHNLLPLKVRCKCETKVNYMTNIETNLVEIDCFHCGSPVTLELNYKAKAYLTIGETGRRS